jgi:hypothetical protein
MRKQEELTNPDSCMSRAHDGEMTFVLLARDKSSPRTIRFWVNDRINEGSNKPDDPQMLEALRCAEIMESECKLERALIQAKSQSQTRRIHE